MKRLLIIAGLWTIFCSASTFAETTRTDGKAIFDRNCSVCHSITPPPKSAPPMMPLASRYHQKFKTKAEGVNHMAAYLKTPDKNKAVDPQAVERFGLMPALSLPDKELRIVSEWVWDQYNSSFGGCGGPGGQGQGRGWRKGQLNK